jgi:hypothetical protein
MSGYPQPPYGVPPQSPPGQYPPGAYPPGYPQPGMMPASRMSVSAVISLVLGIVFCIFGVTSLGAILFGFIGIRATSDPQVRGRGLAITGLVLGLLGVLGWAGCYGIGGYYYHATAGDRVLADTFVQDIVDGKAKEAGALLDPAVDRKQLTASIDSVKTYGTVTPLMTMPSGATRNADGSGTTEVTVILGGNNQKHKAIVQIADHADGSRLVTGWNFLQ